mgnify:CR=1 FL=1
MFNLEIRESSSDGIIDMLIVETTLDNAKIVVENKTDINIDIINNTPYIEIKPQIYGKVKSATDDFDYSSLDTTKIIEDNLTIYLNNLISMDILFL